MNAAGFDVRAYDAADEPAVLELLATALGWGTDGRHRRMFAWKHRDSPFGPSPAWVATSAGQIVGFRTFMRWEFLVDGEPVRAVRAVDTATHPEHRGRGVFAGLTEHALGALREDGVAFVFNTPNDQSRPGYLKMGWRPVGRLGVRARPRSITSIPRLARARTPADRWSLPTVVGVPAAKAFASDPAAIAALVAARPPAGVRTRLSAAYLTWRYGFEPLGYRAVEDGDAGRGLVVFRLRRRGPALEAAICEELLADDDDRLARQLLERVVRGTGADYAVRVGDARPRAGFVPVPRLGPVLVCRPLDGSAAPAAAEWRLGLGDVELF
jgi:GNAT superfamily N-acetyltransferase